MSVILNAVHFSCIERVMNDLKLSWAQVLVPVIASVIAFTAGLATDRAQLDGMAKSMTVIEGKLDKLTDAFILADRTTATQIGTIVAEQNYLQKQIDELKGIKTK